MSEGQRIAGVVGVRIEHNTCYTVGECDDTSPSRPLPVVASGLVRVVAVLPLGGRIAIEVSSNMLHNVGNTTTGQLSGCNNEVSR